MQRISPAILLALLALPASVASAAARPVLDAAPNAVQPPAGLYRSAALPLLLVQSGSTAPGSTPAPSAGAPSAPSGMPSSPASPPSPPAGGAPRGPLSAPGSGSPGSITPAKPLDQAFAALADAPDEAASGAIAERIRALLTAQLSPAAQLLLRRATRDATGQDFGEALDDCDAAITLSPQAAEGWYARARIYAESGDNAAAARDLQEVLRLEPRHFPALILLSRLLAERHDDAGALRAFQAALKIAPHIGGGQKRLQELRQAVEGNAT